MNVDFSGLSHHDKRSLLGGTESHRGNAVFSEHVNYYNIEDDEDKTDMDGEVTILLLLMLWLCHFASH